MIESRAAKITMTKAIGSKIRSIRRRRPLRPPGLIEPVLTTSCMCWFTQLRSLRKRLAPVVPPGPRGDSGSPPENGPFVGRLISAESELYFDRGHIRLIGCFQTGCFAPGDNLERSKHPSASVLPRLEAGKSDPLYGWSLTSTRKR